MVIEQTKCDQCGAVHSLTKKTLQVREVSGITVPQVDRSDAETSSWELMNNGAKKVFVLTCYDFCNVKCLADWIHAGQVFNSKDNSPP